MFSGHHAPMAVKRPLAIWEPTACCALLAWWFCALLVAGEKGAVHEAITICAGVASALFGGLAHQRWQVRFPKP
jgi:hypothetical protein